MQPHCRTVGELNDYLAFILLSAPSNFPAWRKVDLESAFAQLSISVDACADELGGPARVREIKQQAADSLAAYQRGDVVKGAHILQDIKHAL